MDNQNQIALRFSEWVKSTGKKKYEVAEMLGISQSQLSQLLSGRNPLGVTLRERFKALGVDIDWILTGRQKDVSELEKGRVLAKYFIPKQYGVNKVVAESQTTDEGYNVTVYEVVEQKSVMALAAEPRVEYEDEVVPEPQVKVERIRTPIKTVAATPIYVKGQNKK